VAAGLGFEPSTSCSRDNCLLEKAFPNSFPSEE